ncbi:HNH endonuclease [Serratia symbiotica]|uniref:HNH endonuclease n=2 Tax=Serratia symbiotica TaxID=138074 RepID=UPI001888A0EC|nr:HNH endonuclease signature motif containing protein [Serratia symbiotica]MBF1994432.1 HNH endonuclease [Serratia symbiotica]
MVAVKKPYGSKWQAERRLFLQAHPLCVMCQQMGRLEPATVVDHIVPHRLKEAKTPEQMKKAQHLFWSRKNWQGLCKPHHDSTKQRMEKTGRVIGCSLDGLPLDPASHWCR